MNPEPRMLTEEQASHYLGVSKSTLREKLSKQEGFPPRLAGIRRNLYDRKALDRFIDRQSKLEEAEKETFEAIVLKRLGLING